MKRAHEVIDIFNRVLAQTPCRLLMVGDGPDLPRAVGRAKELGITQHINFLGNREDVACLLAASDVVLLPSESESFGLAALEGMACGCAVIASDIGGLPELVRHGVDGYLCPLGDIDEMARRTAALLGDAALLKQLQSAARHRAVTAFNATAVVPQYIDLYRRVLRGEN